MSYKIGNPGERKLSVLERSIPFSEHFKCEICGEWCFGLTSFASHVAQKHKISATQYWNKYGYNNKRYGVYKSNEEKEMEGNENINPSKRILE